MTFIFTADKPRIYFVMKYTVNVWVSQHIIDPQIHTKGKLAGKMYNDEKMQKTKTHVVYGASFKNADLFGNAYEKSYGHKVFL